MEVTEHCSRCYRALLYIGMEQCSLWYRALLYMVRSTAFPDKMDAHVTLPGSYPPKGLYPCETIYSPEGPYTQLCCFTRAKHFESLRSSFERRRQ